MAARRQYASRDRLRAHTARALAPDARRCARLLARSLTPTATLGEAIKRQSRPPVDLFCFYLWLQREGGEDALDFWLDVQQHENLCRAYFKDLRKSGRSVKEDWPQYYRYAQERSSIYNAVTGVNQENQDSAMGEKLVPRDSESEQAAQALSMSVGRPRASVDEGRQSLAPDDVRNLQRTPSPTFDPTHRPHLSPTLKQLYPERPTSPADSTLSRRPRREPVQPVIHRSTAITKTDLIASAEVIYAKYLLQGAEKEIYLPSTLRIHDFPLSADILPSVQSPEYDVESEAMARIPDLYHAQKEYVFRQLEQDAYPRFLRAKAFGNLSPITALIHLVVGLAALWAGFATALAMIFLDQSRAKRLWIVLPFSVALLGIVSHSYDLNPLLVFTPLRTIRIREPYVRKLLVGRAVWVGFVAAFVTTALVALFVLVPGHRL